MSKSNHTANTFWAKMAYNSKAKELVARKCSINEWVLMYDSIEKQWGVRLYPGQDEDHKYYLYLMFIRKDYPFEKLNVNSDLFG